MSNQFRASLRKLACPARPTPNSKFTHLLTATSQLYYKLSRGRTKPTTVRHGRRLEGRGEERRMWETTKRSLRLSPPHAGGSGEKFRLPPPKPRIYRLSCRRYMPVWDRSRSISLFQRWHRHETVSMPRSSSFSFCLSLPTSRSRSPLILRIFWALVWRLWRKFVIFLTVSFVNFLLIFEFCLMLVFVFSYAISYKFDQIWFIVQLSSIVN